mgnify:CR=1 FL=1
MANSSYGVMGVPVRMGSLTDKQIADFYRKQKLDGFGDQAIEELARTEKKTVPQIVKILRAQGCTVIRKRGRPRKK